MLTAEQINEWIQEQQPSWIEGELEYDDLRAIECGGCASGAYMPAVTYHKALATMAEHGDSVTNFVQNYDQDYMSSWSDAPSWSQMACAVLSAAVEIWASNTLMELEDMDCPDCGDSMEFAAVCDDNGHQVGIQLECDSCDCEDNNE